jgi:hypothetical protein
MPPIALPATVSAPAQVQVPGEQRRGGRRGRTSVALGSPRCQACRPPAQAGRRACSRRQAHGRRRGWGRLQRAEWADPLR